MFWGWMQQLGKLLRLSAQPQQPYAHTAAATRQMPPQCKPTTFPAAHKSWDGRNGACHQQECEEFALAGWRPV